MTTNEPQSELERKVKSKFLDSFASRIVAAFFFLLLLPFAVVYWIAESQGETVLALFGGITSEERALLDELRGAAELHQKITRFIETDAKNLPENTPRLTLTSDLKALQAVLSSLENQVVTEIAFCPDTFSVRFCTNWDQKCAASEAYGRDPELTRRGKKTITKTPSSSYAIFAGASDDDDAVLYDGAGDEISERGSVDFKYEISTGQLSYVYEPPATLQKGYEDFVVHYMVVNRAANADDPCNVGPMKTGGN